MFYHGHIDDRYIDFGKSRAEATQKDLRKALDEVLDGKAVSTPVTQAVGCYIDTSPPSAPEHLTFNKDIAPIVYQNCVVCHRSGEVAPFSLTGYDGDVKKRAKQIAAVTRQRYMPPWKAEEGYGDFQNARRLSDEQIAKIRKWVDEGAVEGGSIRQDRTAEIRRRLAERRTDLIVKMPEAYTVAAEGRDVFRCFVLPLNLDEDKYVRSVEYRPSNRAVVHHALFFLDSTGAARKKAEANPGTGTNGT